MTFERNPTPPPEPGPTPVVGTATANQAPTPVQIRLQILSTEHWSLLASRSLAWNESFTRAGMYLSTLSGALVALGLIGGVTAFGTPFYVFALVILPVVLFVGIGTWVRMAAANYHDAMTVFGMNRIRAAYLEIAPELAPYFVMGVHDDPRGISITMAVPPRTPPILHLIAATPFLVMVLNAVVFGAIVALATGRLLTGDGAIPWIVVAALVSAAAAIAAQLALAARNIRSGQQLVVPMFPTPSSPDRRGA